MTDTQNRSQESEGRGPSTTRHVIKWIFILIVIAIVLGVLIQLLWNWLMPPIFGLPRINGVQGVGLLVLVRMFFGRMGKRREHAGYLTGKYGFLNFFGGKRNDRETSAT